MKDILEASLDFPRASKARPVPMPSQTPASKHQTISSGRSLYHQRRNTSAEKHFPTLLSKSCCLRLLFLFGRHLILAFFHNQLDQHNDDEACEAFDRGFCTRVHVRLTELAPCDGLWVWGDFSGNLAPFPLPPTTLTLLDVSQNNGSTD